MRKINLFKLLFAINFLFATFLLFAQEGNIIICSTEPVTIPSGPDFALMKDISGAGSKREIMKDNRASPGETFLLDIRIQNIGTVTARGLWAELSSKDQRIGKYIFLERSKVFIGDLAPGASTTLTNSGVAGSTMPFFQSGNLDKAFRFSLDKLCSTASISFEITFLDSNGKKWAQTLTIPVNPAENIDVTTIGRFSFYITSKIIEKETDWASGLGWDYNNRLSGEIKLERSISNATGLHWELKDSLSVFENETYEVYFIPLRYDFFRAPSYRLWGGIGGYYHDETADYRGFFDYPDLAQWDAQTLNSFKSNITYRLLGPHLDFGFTYRGSDWFKIAVSGGVIPVFGIWINHEISCSPLMANNSYEGSQVNIGGPNFYADLNGIISLPGIFSKKKGQPVRPSDWKLWYSVFFYSWKLPNETVQPYWTMADDWHWAASKVDMLTANFTVEGALLIPIGGIYLQIGGGRIFSSTWVDSNHAGDEGTNFINISGKLLKF